MVAIKVFKPETDYTKAFTTKFVCKSTGVALKK
jgi:NitT/TauT family transport system substrate-binding protein